MKKWQNSQRTKSSLKRLKREVKIYSGARFTPISHKKENTEIQEIAKKYGKAQYIKTTRTEMREGIPEV